MDIYAIIGRPVAHSRSPFLFQLFAAQTHQQLQYDLIETTSEQLHQTIQDFKNRGGKGLNVTLPFKELACQSVDILSERARRAKAINVIHFQQNGQAYGDNVDGIGLIRDLRDYHQITLKHKRILILGTGGAVRGILLPLLNEQPANITIVNRTPEKAAALAAEFDCSTAAFHELTDMQFDIVINGTSASMTHASLPLPNNILNANACCYDMVYGKTETPFSIWAAKNNASLICDGLGMLIEQAAETFYIWRGIKPDTHAIRSALLTQD